jgi:hypothetical protein
VLRLGVEPRQRIVRLTEVHVLGQMGRLDNSK